MSTAETALDFNALDADIIETSTGRRIREASAVRWVWQCFKDIKLFENNRAAVMNNLTLRERPFLENGRQVYENKRPVMVSDPVTVLRRCQPYPVTNCEYEIPLHEVDRYGMTGEEIPEASLPESYAGTDPKNPVPRHTVKNKFAYSCAVELVEKYGKEYGLTVLEPLTGEEDSEVVRKVFELVQPVTYTLANLERELTDGAKSRIRKSTHSKEIKDKAEGCRALMLKGLQRAIAFAKERHGDFALQIQKASAGHKGNRVTATEFDEHVCEQLGIEVPRVVQTTTRRDRDDEKETLREEVAELRGMVKTLVAQKASPNGAGEKVPA